MPVLPLRSSILALRSWGLLILALGVAGCQPAGRYSSKPPTRQSPEPVAVPPLAKSDEQEIEEAANLLWQPADPAEQQPDVPLVFVHESQPDWKQLTDFWNPEWHRPVLALGAPALGVAALAGAGQWTPAIRIKVPLGLDDPTAHIPAANPPTYGKWRLGKDLFFDDRVLLQKSDTPALSCARCHHPAASFTDPKITLSVDTPTLINCVYNRNQFWDGRAEALEQVVQLEAGDEEGKTRRLHAWPGVVERLRGHAEYARRFRQVFGTPPTQDAVGKAVATYLRTILAGNAVLDRAEQVQRGRGGKALEQADCEAVLDEPAWRLLPWEHGDRPTRPELAAELLKGYTLFHGQAGCAQCHSGRTYSDGAFHNLAIPQNQVRVPGHEPGRFRSAPLGQKDLHLIGAVKTPTLRALLRTAPYFHTAREVVLGRSLDETLFQVVVWHVKEAPARRGGEPFLDPLIQPRALKEDEIRSLVVFLKALVGEPVPAIVADRQR